MTRHLLFCSDLSLGYHNPEAERTLAGLMARGYGGTFVDRLGIRNPSLQHRGELVQRLRRRATTPTSATQAPPPPFATCAPSLLLPRRAPGIDGLNRRWLARQLAVHVPDPGRTIPWVRYPTPELIPFLERRSWPLVVYEVVDDHEASPGLNGRLRRVFRAAEDRLLARAGVVVASSPLVAERLANRHPRVELIAAAAFDDAAFAAARTEVRPADRVAVYVGALDERLDTRLLADVASALPEWRFRVVGPLEAGAGAEHALAGVGNVEWRGAVAPNDVPAILAGATVCVAPYRRSAFNDTLFPIKLVEGLASGRPVVSTPIAAARGFADVVELAGDVPSFAAAIRRAAAEPPGAAAIRIARAAPYRWDARLDALVAAIEGALR